jgi:uncharacterized protein YbjT (DUF2867 family)
MKYLVTGATGNIGSLVTERLIEKGEKPCLLVRDAKKARKLFGDHVEVRGGDLEGSRVDLAKSFQGCDSLFLINSGPKLGQLDRICAGAAQDAGIKHLVKLSTIDVETGIGTGPWHAMGEDAIRGSGVDFTFIRTAAFMSNALSWADSIREDGVLSTSTGDGKIAFIHPDDIADVVVSVLVMEKALNDALVITGPAALSYKEMAAAIGKAIGKTVEHENLSDTEAMKDTLMWADRVYAEALVDIWRSVREGRLTTVSNGVEEILGRSPKNFADWVSENAGHFDAKAKRSR